MLTLSRRTGETILIGSDIVIHVRHIVGQQARISIEAPREVSIVRGELLVEDNKTHTTSSKSRP